MLQTMFIQFIEEYSAVKTISVSRSVKEKTYYFLAQSGNNLMTVTVNEDYSIDTRDLIKRIMRNNIQIKELTFSYI